MPRPKSQQSIVSKGSTPVARKPQKNQMIEFKESSVASSAVSYAKRMGFGGTGKKDGSSAMRNVRKTEFISSINGSVLFNVTSFPLNPGLPSVFPWLSQIAKDFQQYRFNRFRVRYITRCATTLGGSVILSPQYNLSEGPPPTEQQAVDTQDSVEDVVWREITCELDCKAMFAFGPRKQVRTAAIGSDLATYDAALMSVATIGEADSSMVGKLYFDYDVDFFVPQSVGPAKALSQRVTEFAFFANQVTTVNVGTILTNWAVINNPIGVVNSGAGVFTFPQGQYRLDIIVNAYCNAGSNLFSTVYTQVNGLNFGPITRISSNNVSTTGANLHVNSYIYGTLGGDPLTILLQSACTAVLPVVGAYLEGTRFLITLI